MLCDICHKNEATIHIQEIAGGQKKTMHLCSMCAAAKQQGGGLDLGPFNLAGLLYKLSGSAGESENGQEPETEVDSGQIVCPQCSWSESKLRESGKLGCPECYKVFGALLKEALKNMHRGTCHLGKHPVGQGSGLCVLHGELALLQKKLQQEVDKENYEAAAVLRDQINALKKQCDEAAAAEPSERSVGGE